MGLFDSGSSGSSTTILPPPDGTENILKGIVRNDIERGQRLRGQQEVDFLSRFRDSSSDVDKLAKQRGSIGSQALSQLSQNGVARGGSALDALLAQLGGGAIQNVTGLFGPISQTAASAERGLGQQSAAASNDLGFSINSALGQNQARAFQDDQRLRGIQAGAQDRLLSDLQRGNQASLSDLGNIGRFSDLAIQSGLSDLTKFQEDSLERIRNASAERGLRPGDTPITDQFQDLGEENSRQAQQLISQIRGQQAQQNLLFPLQRGQLTTQQFGALQSGTQGQRELGQGILAQGEANRLAQIPIAAQLGLGQLGEANRVGLGLGSLSQQLGLALADLQGQATFNRAQQVGQQGQFLLGTADPQNALAIAQRPRLAQGAVSVNSSTTPSAFDQIGSLLGGAGGALSGIGGLLGGGGAGAAGAGGLGGALGGLGALSGLFPSDADLKRVVGALDSRRTLRDVRPVRYQYLDPEMGAGEQAGILAQDLEGTPLAGAVERTPQGRYVHAGRLVGAMLGLLADISQRLERLEEAHGVTV